MKNLSLEFDSASGDFSLMEMLIERKPEALRMLYDRYRAVLRSIIMQIVRDEADTDDVIQDVFCQLWTKPETYCAEKGKPFAWLITLARRRAIDCLRRRQAYSRATDRFETLHSQSQGSIRGPSIVEQTAAGDDLRGYLKTLIHQLPAAQKIVIEQGFFGAMSQRQIARTMRLPLGTIKTRMELGVKKLAHTILPIRERVA